MFVTVIGMSAMYSCSCDTIEWTDGSGDIETKDEFISSGGTEQMWNNYTNACKSVGACKCK